MRNIIAGALALLLVAAPAVATNLPTLPNDNKVDCILTGTGTCTVATSGAGTVSFNLSSSGASGLTYNFQGTSDGSHWFTVSYADPTASPPLSFANSTLNATSGQWIVAAAGLQKVRFNLTAFSAGTLTVHGEAGAGSAITYVVGGSVAASGTFTCSACALETGGNLATLAGAVSGSLFQVNLSKVGGTTAVNAGVAGTLAVGGNQATNTNISTGLFPLEIGGSDYGGTPKLQAVKVDSSGNVQVVCTSGCGSGSPADEAAFTAGSTGYTPFGGLYQTSATSNPLTTGQGGVAQLTINRALHVNLRNATGTEIGTSGAPMQVTLANTGANTNKLLVTPDSVALPANQSVNVSQVAGTTTDTNSGTKSAGTQRVVLATDQPALTNPQPVAFSTGNAQAQPHVCGSYKFVHITSATDTQIVAASGSNTIYICDFEFSVGAVATNFYLEKATSGTCATLTQLGILHNGSANMTAKASNAFYRGLNTGASAQLCVNTNAAGPLDIGVFYDQY